jgi:RNA polymerase sigma-70 factor (ECF subfamily)
MDSTSVSLLRRLREPDHQAAWQRFVDLYAPLIFHWGVNHGLSTTDAAELVQEVLAVLVTKLPGFQYDPKRRFRGWLRTITVNKANDFHRRSARRPHVGQEEVIRTAVVASDVDLFAEEEYRKYLFKRTLELIQVEFRDQIWQWVAVWKSVVEGQKAAEIAQVLGVSVNMVYLAKSRVLARLREELDGLVD